MRPQHILRLLGHPELGYSVVYCGDKDKGRDFRYDAVVAIGQAGQGGATHLARSACLPIFHGLISPPACL